ncbi:MAG: methionine synthase, partial [Bacteroidota bacterium]|nr:methionine synthase [Bacteroidota bacterium]
KLLSDIADCNVSAYPNAGLPNEFGNYDESPEVMAENVREFLEDGIVNIIGGCCGTTPEHIKQIADLVGNYKPRRIPELKKYTCLSGLETLTIYPDSNFINIGERTNVAGSAKFARLIREENYEEAISVARQQIEGGALIIDINMDDAMINAREAMVRFLNLIAAEPEISKVPFMIDSSDWNVIEAALKCIQGKSIVNSISLKDGEEMFIEKARKIKNYGAAAIVMAFDENGQAVTYHKKIEICERSYKILTERVGLHPQDIIFDPNILTVATGMEEHNNYAVDYLNAVSWIKENLKGCLVSGGLSNLSFAFRGNNSVREAMNSIFLYHAIKAGMNMGIVNAGMIQVYDDIPVELLNLIENVLFNRHPGATEKLIDYAHNVVRATGKDKMEEQWRSFEVDERLGYAIIHGIVKHIDEDIDEALKKYITALKVIEIPLMNGMKKVGELFGSGKMFLPQVVKSARVMKKAVSVLLPYVEADKASGNTSSGKILLATVKGDVHDIGKNIASVVLACNNYEIIDLGVMTSCDKIIQTAIEQKVDIIGLSGLITPSLDEMIVVAKEMEKHHLKIPLIIGGATTSGIHTAVKIQPEYSGLVIHVSDASQGVNVCNQLMKNYETFSLEHKTDYNNLREEYFKNQMKKHFLTIEEARKNKWKTDWYKAQITKPSFIGSKVFLDYPIKEISKYIDWNRFFKIWELKGHYPEILSDCKYGSEATKMFSDANEMINEVVNGNLLSARAVIGIFEANAINDDDILIKATNTNNQTTLHFLRQQLIKSNNMPSFCLADFIAPLESGRIDYIGAFAVSVGFGTQELENAYKKRNDNYKALMIRILSDLLSEAFIELIHEKVRKEYWGYAKDENLTIQQILSEKYTGIRPAPGYPACPDHTEKRTLFDLLKVEETIGITLTENYFMVPESSVSGWFFANPEAKYIAVSKISHDQLEDYAKRKSMTIEEAGKWLSQNLFY